MENPITNDVFDSRDLIEYKEHLESEMVDYFNDYIEEHNELCVETVEEKVEEIDSIDDVDFGLEVFGNRYNEEIEHYEAIVQFCHDLNYGDFPYGETIIHADYFTEYTEDLCKDTGYLPNDLPSWIENHISTLKIKPCTI